MPPFELRQQLLLKETSSLVVDELTDQLLLGLLTGDGSMPGLGGRGGGLMVPGGGGGRPGRRSSMYPGGGGGGGPPGSLVPPSAAAVNSRRHSSRSGDIGYFSFVMKPNAKHQNFSDESMLSGSKYLTVPNNNNQSVMFQDHSGHRGSITSGDSGGGGGGGSGHHVSFFPPPAGRRSSIQQRTSPLATADGTRASVVTHNGKSHMRVCLKEDHNEEILTNPSAVRLLQQELPVRRKSDCPPDFQRTYYPTNSGRFFHCYLVLGLIGFFVFWLVLMLRIYLPERYWTWSYIW